MKVIKYNLCTHVNYGTEEAPELVPMLSAVKMQWNECNEQIAKAEAWEGRYSIEEEPEEVTAPTRMDAMEAQLAYTAMMTDTLLEV